MVARSEGVSGARADGVAGDQAEMGERQARGRRGAVMPPQLAQVGRGSAPDRLCPTQEVGRRGCWVGVGEPGSGLTAATF